MTPDPSTPNFYQVLTGAGPSAIAIVALSGPRVPDFAARHLRLRGGASSQVQRAALLDADGEPIDEAIVIRQSESSLELHLHGNPALVRCCCRLLGDAFGFRASESLHLLTAGFDPLDADAAALAPAIITRRGLAWLSAQPERLRRAAAEIAAMSDREQAERRVAEIVVRGRIVEWFTRPLRVAVLGPPNAGKSTLVNALVDHPVSITSPAAGTTRDYVEALDEVDGFPVAWLDTAGLRTGVDALEQAGIERAREVGAAADVVVLVLESGSSNHEQAVATVVSSVRRPPNCIVLSKCDLAPPARLPRGQKRVVAGRPALATSATQRIGLEDLRGVILDLAGRSAAELDLPAAFAPQHLAWLAGIARRS